MRWLNRLLTIGLVLPVLFIANGVVDHNAFAGNALTAAGQNLRRSSIWNVQAAAPEICIEVYQPVCGTDQSGKQVTYSNDCFARMAKATNVTPGECVAGPLKDANAVLDRWIKAFNANNVEAIVQLYATDALFLGISGPKLNAGREAIREYLKAAPETGTTVSTTDRHLIELSDAAVTAVGLYRFDFLQEGVRVLRLARFTFVVAKRGDDWLIIHHHSSLVPPAPLQ
jgi:uncharacterized protein (TIGR02246 family)